MPAVDGAVDGLNVMAAGAVELVLRLQEQFDSVFVTG